MAGCGRCSLGLRMGRAVRVLNHVGRSEWEQCVIPSEHCESNEALEAFLSQAAKDICGVSEDCITKCVSNRSGPISRPIRNYAGESGAAAGNTPSTLTAVISSTSRC